MPAGFVALVLAFPDMTSVPLGFLRHEASFAGKPTNHWIRALRQESSLGQAQPASDIGPTIVELNNSAER
jgi:hypothetical protein